MAMKREFRMYAALALWMALSPMGGVAEGAESHSYKVAIDAEFAPFEFTSHDHKVKGIAPDILRAIGKSAGVTFIFMPMSWNEAVMALQTGRVDLLQMIRTDQRARGYAFSEPFIELTQALFRNRKHPDVGEIVDMKGKRIAIQKNDIAAELLAGRDDIRVVFVNNKHQGFELLQLGQVDGLFAAELPGNHILQTSSYPDIELARGGLYPMPLCFTAGKENAALITLINRELARLQQSGRVDAMISKWKHPGKSGGAAAWMPILVATLALVAGAIWMRARRKRA